MEEASDGIILTDGEGKITAVNMRLCQMLGYEKDDFFALTLHQLLPDEDRFIFPLTSEDLGAGKTVAVEHRLRRKDATVIYVETNAKKLVDGRIQGIVRDISAQKEKEGRFKRLIREEVFEKLFVKLRAFKHGQSGAMNLNRIALLAENLEMLIEKEVRGTRRRRADSGRPDPTTQKDLLNRFGVAVEEFTNIVAPDLNHIASLVMLTEINVARSNASDDFQPTADTLLSLVEHLKQKLESIMTLSKDFSSRAFEKAYQALQANVLRTITEIRYCLSDISDVIETNYTSEVSDVVRASTLKFESKSSEVCIELMDLTEGSKAIFNPSELDKVMTILIENSLEAFEGVERKDDRERRRVVIRTGSTEGMVQVIVEDNGPGVQQELRDHLFESGVSSKSPEGGFGLRYAKECVTKYGGRIYLDQSVGSGSRFVVEIPKA
jgi:PAS domain S-box-containing protein